MSSMQTDFDPRGVTRPVGSLLAYYLIASLRSGPAFPILAVLGYFKYRTLRYRFDDDGVAMSWGILFRREIYLTYRRIQDIHLTRNILQRWFNLARIDIQTASGSARAEMSIEGIHEFDELRDFLYERMRGARGILPDDASSAPADQEDEALLLLREIHASLRQLLDREDAA